MKNLNIFLFLFILCYSGSALAQDKLFLTTGDTLSGKIDILLAGDNFEEVMMESADNKERYRSHQFIGLVKDNEQFRTLKYGDKYRIMKVQIDGYLSLLRFRSQDNYMYNAMYLYKMDGNGMEVPTLSFKKNLVDFTNDCPSVSSKIESGELKRRDLDDIVTEYNTCLNRRTEAKYSDTETIVPANEPNQLVTTVKQLVTRARELKDTDLATMLTDVANKLQAGDAIPGYLKSALTDHVKDGNALKDEVDTLVNEL